MPSQTKTWQTKILAAARQDNYKGLYWYVEGTLPYSQRQTPHGLFPAAWPGAYVPVIPVGPCAETSRQYVELLTESFRLGNKDQRIQFAPAITADDLLAKANLQWYLWGTTPQEWQIDLICPHCGGISQFDIATPLMCDCMSQPISTEALRKLGLYEITSSYVDGAIWQRIRG